MGERLSKVLKWLVVSRRFQSIDSMIVMLSDRRRKRRREIPIYISVAINNEFQYIGELKVILSTYTFIF